MSIEKSEKDGEKRGKMTRRKWENRVNREQRENRANWVNKKFEN